MGIKALLGFHPKGAEKSAGMTGIKVAKSSQGDSLCFWMLKDDGKEEDFSSLKCLAAIEANPPYAEADVKPRKEAMPAPKAEADPAEDTKIAESRTVETMVETAAAEETKPA